MRDRHPFSPAPAAGSAALMLPAPAVETPPPIAGEPVAAPSAGGYRLWKAVHRRGVLAVLLAIPTAVAAGAGVWHFKPDKYTTASLLRLAATDRTILFETADERETETFLDYKRTQRQLIGSPDVLMAALRDEDVADIPALRQVADPLTWLEKHLDVTFPDDTQVMKVALSGYPPQGLEHAVNAVVDSYLEVYVQKERERKRLRLSSLTTTHAEFEKKLRSRRSELEQRQELLGESSEERLSLEQQSALQRYSGLQQQLLKVQLDILQGEIESEQPVESAEVRAARLEDEFRLIARVDPELQRLEAEKDRFEKYAREFAARVQPKTAAGVKSEHDQRLQTHRAGIAAREEELRKEFMEFQQRSDLNHAAGRKRDIVLLRAREQHLLSRLNESRGGLTRADAPPSTDVEMLRVDIEVLEDVLKEILGEIERTSIELQPSLLKDDAARTIGRVTVLSSAYPARKADPLEKMKTAFAAASAGFLLPILLLIWLESRNDRILTRDEITHGAGLSVLGAVPLIPRPIMRRLSDSRGRQSSFWRSRLTESVDLVAAMLQRSSKLHSLKTVMVSSSMSGEGKTTLATNLAASLAAAGSRVALIDFDLRRPALHRVFDLPLEPGICEVLQHLEVLDTAIQLTQVPNLYFIAAGKSGQRGLSKLADEDVKGLFAALREQFDFVVVDTSPILPVVDACLIGQHVDTVLLSVLSDVSRMAQVRMAAHQLEDFDVSVAGVVMIGTSRDVYPLTYDDKYCQTLAG